MKFGPNLGEGGFGVLYTVINRVSGQKMALKLEDLDNKLLVLENEARIYAQLSGGLGIPRTIWLRLRGNRHAMLIDFLGPSLEDLFVRCNHSFSLKTVLMLGIQFISRLEFIHGKSIVHRDIKPEHILMGVADEASRVNIVDFGLAQQYRCPETNQCLPYSDHHEFYGTGTFASINTHLGVEQGPRDDMEALGNMLIYLRCGLPWMDIKKESYNKTISAIGVEKITITIDDLCDGLPNEFHIYMRHVRRLHFGGTPNYAFLRELFRQWLVREGFQLDSVYD